MNEYCTFTPAIDIIPDEQFEIEMNQKVVPYLQSICQHGYLPISGSCHALQGSSVPDAKGNALYYEIYRPVTATGAVVISHGYCESAEKYKEVIYYFTQAGYEVYIAEHRGHGRSFRETTHPNMVHVSDFSSYVTDLHAFISTIVRPYSDGLPLYLFAHSMGGAVGALYLQTYPDTFTRAILSAPMLALSIRPLPVPCAIALGHIMTLLHRSENYAPGQHAFSPGRNFEKSGCSCPERFYYYQEKRESFPCFQNSGSSYGWAYHSLNACRLITQKKNCNKITAPVLVFRSLDDSVVAPSGILRFVKNTPSSKQINFEGSRHEIYNSPASILKKYYQEIFKFLTQT